MVVSLGTEMLSDRVLLTFPITHTLSLTPSPPPILLLTLTIDEHVTHEPTFLTQKEDGKEEKLS